MLSLLCAAVVQPDTSTTDLCLDTYISAETPDKNFGRDLMLEAGEGKAILIEFLNLHNVSVADATLRFRTTGPNTARLKSISVMNRPWTEGGGRATTFPLAMGLANLDRSGATWNGDPLGDWVQDGASAPQDATPIPGATMSMDGEWLVIAGLGEAVQAQIDAPWNNHGFRIEFEGDIRLLSGDTTFTRPQIVIETQRGATDGPDIAVIDLQADLPADSWPADGTPIKWTATVRNLGDAPAEPHSVTWKVNGERVHLSEVADSLAPEAEATVSTTIPFIANGRAEVLAVASPNGPDAMPFNNGFDTHMRALTIAYTIDRDPELVDDWAQLPRNVLEALNGLIFPLSRSRVAPKGIAERLRVHSVSADEPEAGAHFNVALKTVAPGDLGALELLALWWEEVASKTMRGLGAAAPASIGAPYSRTLSGRDDARDDTLVLDPFALTAPIWNDEDLRGIELPNHNFVGRGSAYMLNSMQGLLGGERMAKRYRMPKICLITFADAMGAPIVGARVSVKDASGREIATGTTGDNGAYLLNSQPAPSGSPNPFGELEPGQINGYLTFELSRYGESATAHLPIWRLWEQYALGNTEAGILEIRAPLASAPIDRTTNRALNRIVTDSAGRFPAELQAVVDGSLANYVPLNTHLGDAWIEIDLGRDRPIGEIELVMTPTMWDKFEIQVYNTSENPSDARVWYRSPDARLDVAVRGTEVGDGVFSLPLRATAEQVRYIRLVVPRGAGDAAIREIRVYPATPIPLR